MLIASLMRRYREKKTREAIELRNEGKKAQVKDDDWVAIELRNEGKKAQVEEDDWVAVEWTNEGKKAQVEEDEDDWVFIDSQSDVEKEWAHYVELLCELIDVLQEAGKDEREILQMFKDSVDARIEKGDTLSQQKEEVYNFAEERNEILKELEEIRAELKRQRNEEDVKQEKEFDEKLAPVRGRTLDMS